MGTAGLKTVHGDPDVLKVAIVQNIGDATLITGAGFAAKFVADSAPSGGTAGGLTNSFSKVRTYITYAGSVTAAVLRVYTRMPGGTTWFRGGSSDDDTPLTGTNESRDWLIGAGIEVLFILESISPGTAGNTIAVAAEGIQ